MSDGNVQDNHLGAALITAFYRLISTIRIHQDNNQSVKELAAKLHMVVAEMSLIDDVSIKIWRERFIVQDQKLLYQRETIHVINEMLDYFTQRGLGGFCFLSNVKTLQPEDILAFTRLLNDCVKHDDPAGWLDSQLEGNGFPWVEIYRQFSEKGRDGKRRGEQAQQAYSRAMGIVQEVADKASKGVAGVRKARRLAQTIVDLIHEDNSLMLGLATIRDYDDYTYTHSVNVALLATCLGRHIGLSKVFLEHLTVCGLFHDLGKVGVSKDILLKHGELNNDEWDKMRKHPLIGVRNILRLQAPHALKSRIILGPFEHHLNPDMTGYPKTHFMKKLSLLGRILRIVDVYDALTSERVYRPRAFTPDEALRRMWSEREKSFDPLLLKSFVNMMGLYPIGSVVELDSGEKALVMDYPDESEKSLPLVLILEDDGNGAFVRGEKVDLSSQHSDGFSFQRNIARGLHASRLGIKPSQFFMEELESSGIPAVIADE